MSEIANARTGQEISEIDELAMQARALRLSINVNMWQLARVFIEAKKLVPHGEWDSWLKENANVGKRTAEDMMAAYRRFGSNPSFANLGQTKTFKLLPLPEGAEEDFLREHDVERMSTREIQEAVRKAREDARAETLREMANRPPEIPAELTEELERSRDTIARQREEIDRLAETGRESLEEQRRLAGENVALQKENREYSEMLVEQQDALNQAQAELLNARSAIAKGDAERIPADSLTADSFAQAVRAFIGTVARLPHMRMAFARMDISEKEEYSTLLETVEKWAEDSRKALDMTFAEGAVI